MRTGTDIGGEGERQNLVINGATTEPQTAGSTQPAEENIIAGQARAPWVIRVLGLMALVLWLIGSFYFQGDPLPANGGYQEPAYMTFQPSR